MRLFHYSEDAGIQRFTPRPVRIRAERPPGWDWLNGPLVWAIDEPHGILYLFPRDCPRIVVWPRPGSTDADRRRWMGETTARAVAYVEAGWMERLRAASVWRYELPPETFEDVRDVGMWVSRREVRPLSVAPLGPLEACHVAAGVELRAMERLTPLRQVWDSSLHASGVRLRNALGWGAPGWPHTPPAEAPL